MHSQSQFQSIRYDYDHHHDLPIYQAEVITGRRRRSIDNNEVVFATSYYDRSGSSISSSESGYLSSGRSDDGNERRASNSLRLIRVIISFTLLFAITIRYVGGVDTSSSSPLELMAKMILMPHQMNFFPAWRSWLRSFDIGT